MHKNGFTILEVMVVIMILGMLAIIIVPRLSNGSDKDQSAAINADLQKVRAQIEIYKYHHKGEFPVLKGESSGEFARRMTTETNVKGDAGKDFGPYLDSVPTNPVNGKNTVRIDGDPAGANTDGWRFDTVTGYFQADDSVENAVL